MDLRTLVDLTTYVNLHWDTDLCLDMVAKTALDVTRSRNAMIARMVDEEGVVQLTHGAGSEWNDRAVGRVMPLGEGDSIVGYVAAKGRRFLSGNVQAEPLYQDLFPSSRSELAVPVRDRHGRIRAVFNVESDEEHHYTDADVLNLEAIAGIAGLIISRDELLRREEALLEIGSALDRATTEEELLNRTIQIASEQLRFQSCAVFLLDRTTQRYVLRAAIGPLGAQIGTGAYDAGDGLTGWVCKHGQAIRLAEPQNDPRWRGRILEIPADQIAGFLAVPIDVRGESVGAIRVLRRKSDNPHHDHRFTEDEERILSAVSEQLATGIESIRTLRRVVQIERMAAWGELSAKSSHMIGNRVFALKGDINELGHLLKEDPVQMDDLIAVSNSLQTNVTRVDEILQEFRDFVTATQLVKARAEVNFLVRQAVEEVFPKRSTVSLDFALTDGLPEVEIDARKLRRAVTEIVENALSFFDQGRLRVSTSLATLEQVVHGRLAREHQYVAIEIADQGPGVEEDRKQEIFQPFHSSRVKGMGLGLSIVKGILEAHGGAVWEEGEPGAGATFVLLLPCLQG